MKATTVVRLVLLLALAAAASSLSCLAAYVRASSAITPDGGMAYELAYWREKRTEIFLSLATSGAVVVYVVLFLGIAVFCPLSRLVSVWADVLALSALLWASAAAGGLLSPSLRALWACPASRCKLALAGNILKWAEVLMLLLSLAAILISKLRRPATPWSSSLARLPCQPGAASPALTRRALYESRLLQSVSLAGNATPPGAGGLRVYSVASPSAVALPVPAHAPSRRSSRGARSRPTTYFNSWAEGRVHIPVLPETLVPASPEALHTPMSPEPGHSGVGR